MYCFICQNEYTNILQLTLQLLSLLTYQLTSQPFFTVQLTFKLSCLPLQMLIQLLSLLTYKLTTQLPTGLKLKIYFSN